MVSGVLHAEAEKEIRRFILFVAVAWQGLVLGGFEQAIEQAHRLLSDYNNYMSLEERVVD
jgi:hypothetical protein